MDETHRRLRKTLVRLHELAKGGPYIGPRGGLWADPEHTVHWESNPQHHLSSAQVRAGLTAILEKHFPTWGGHDEIAAHVLSPGSTYDHVYDAMVDAGARDIMPPDDFKQLTESVTHAVHAVTVGRPQDGDTAMAHAGRVVARWSASEDLYGLPIRSVEIQAFRRGSGSKVTPFADVVVTLSRPATDEDAEHVDAWVRRVQRWRKGATSHVHGNTISVNVEADADDVDALRDAVGRDSSVHATVTAGEDDIDEWNEEHDDPLAKLLREERASRPISTTARTQRVGAVAAYLGFADRAEAEALAERIVAHAGAVWVAPDLDLDEKAERAARAWLRHNVTEYDATLDDARSAGLHRDDYYTDDKRGAMLGVDAFLRRKRAT